MSVNPTGGATSVANTRFVTNVALIAGGFAASAWLTGQLRQKVVDIDVPFADAIYGLIGAAATMTVSRSRTARSLALGMAAGGAVNELDNMTDLV